MKHIVCLVAWLAITSAGYAQSSKPQVQVHKSSDDSYVIVVQSITSDSVETARQELLPDAQRVCDSRSVRFGEFQFDGPPKGKKGVVLLMQQVRCVDAAPPTTVVTDPQWRPTEQQQGIILELTRRYFRFKDAGDFEQLRQFLAPSLSYADWLAMAEKFNKQAGEVRYRKFEKVTWYKDPPNAFAPGLFTAVDFTGQSANADIYCGFVIWHRGQDNMTKLLREEQNQISRVMQLKMSADQLMAARKKLGC